MLLKSVEMCLGAVKYSMTLSWVTTCTVAVDTVSVLVSIGPYRHKVHNLCLKIVYRCSNERFVIFAESLGLGF